MEVIMVSEPHIWKIFFFFTQLSFKASINYKSQIYCSFTCFKEISYPAAPPGGFLKYVPIKSQKY